MSGENRFPLKFLTRGIAIYLLVFAIAFGLLGFMYHESYRITYNSIARETAEHISSGQRKFDGMIELMVSTGELFSSDEHYKRLCIAGPDAGIENSDALLHIRDRLKRMLTINQDSIRCICVLFPNNHLMATNYSAGLKDADIYPSVLSVEDQTLEEWRSRILSKNTDVLLLPQETMYFKGENRPISCVSCVIRSPFSEVGDAKCVFVFLIDKKVLAESFVGPDKLDDAVITVRNKTGAFLASYGVTEHEADEIGLTESMSGDYLGIEVSITRAGIEKRIHGITRILRLTLCGGLLGLMLFIGIYVALHMRREYQLVMLTRQYASEPFRSGHSLDYVHDTITAIARSQSLSEKKLALLQSTWQNEMLADACMHGVLTIREQEQVNGLIEQLGESYRIIAIEAPDEDRAVAADELFRHQLNGTVLQFYRNRREPVFIVPVGADDAQTLTATERLHEMMKVRSESAISIGISLTKRGINGLNKAYEEAELALHVSRTGGGGISVYGTDVQGMSEPCISVNVLGKVTDHILMGETKELKLLFDEMKKVYFQPGMSSMRYMYFFAMLRMGILNASAAIIKDGTFEVPGFKADEDAENAVERLWESAEQLCAVVRERRRSNNQKLFEEMVSYISVKFTDPNLDAESIAQKFDLSKAYVLHFFQMQSGKTLSEYIEQLRLDYVDRYLQNTDWEIERIMEVTGYISQNTLYRAFKKRHGVTPGVFRKSFGK